MLLLTLLICHKKTTQYARKDRQCGHYLGVWDSMRFPKGFSSLSSISDSFECCPSVFPPRSGSLSCKSLTVVDHDIHTITKNDISTDNSILSRKQPNGFNWHVDFTATRIPVSGKPNVDAIAVGWPEWYRSDVIVYHISHMLCDDNNRPPVRTLKFTPLCVLDGVQIIV